MRLVLTPTGAAQSLIHKASEHECLAARLNIPMFTVTQHRPYDNELQLAYPAKLRAFPAESVRCDRLIVQFSLVGYEAIIQIANCRRVHRLHAREVGIQRVHEPA